MGSIENNTRFDDGMLSPYIIVFKRGQYEIYKKKISNRLEKNNGKKTGETYEREVLVGMASSLENCIERVIKFRIEAGNKKVKTLLDFYSNLKKISDETHKVFGKLVKTEEERIVKLEERLTENKKSILSLIDYNDNFENRIKSLEKSINKLEDIILKRDNDFGKIISASDSVVVIEHRKK